MRIKDRRSVGLSRPEQPIPTQTCTTLEIDPHTRIQTPWGIEIVKAIQHTYTRRVEGRSYKFFKITFYTNKSLTTWEYTKWDILH